jgi:hypothetical protein
MVTIGKLVLTALMAIVAAAVAGAGFSPRVAVVPVPAPKRPVGKAPVADPAEPAMTVQATYDDQAPGGAPRIPRGGRGGWTGRPVAVAAGPKGATLTLDTPGLWQGWAALTFKNSAPPMRLTLRLAKMPNYDLESLTLSSGTLSLAVGPVSASVTTKYFDARGREQDASEGAAYTVTARRWDGEVEVEVRRSRGASLGKELTVAWKSHLRHGRGLPHHY